MPRKFTQTTSLVLALGLVLSCSQATGEARSPVFELTVDAQKVVDYLVEDWNKQFRSTSIPLAMTNLGLGSNDKLRLQIGKHLRENTDLARNLQWWGANNYILSNDEKVIAKYLINTFDATKELPDLPTAAKAVGLSESDLRTRLGFMTKAGLLQKSRDHKLGYALADGYEKWGGPLRHNFHSVAIAGEKPFDVW